MSTINDVAKLANVSIATVSRVLNKSENVSEKTKIKVLKVIEELGFEPSKDAKNLATLKNKNILVLTSERILKITDQRKDYGIDEFYKAILMGIEDGFKNTKTKIELKNYDQINENYIQKFDGIIIIGSDPIPNYIENIKIPIVLLDNYIPGKDYNCVVSNGYDGAYFAINKMIKRNYKKIYHLHGSLSYYGFKTRYEGYKSAMQDNGLMPETFECDETEESIKNALNILLKKQPEVIFTSNDPIALILIDLLKKKKIKIPEKVQIIGFDDIIQSSISTPKLSTVKIFKYEMGNNAALRINELINGINVHPVMSSVFTKFVERDTTKKEEGKQ
ncbi:LacI family transcriptional regulator [Oceanotoga sp. DSM 15011]|uniref:LacI family DNA-binding transcriptional regulator n=1 Tax=unclassified Oceanotoga TaxID=2618448 RepID=UPI0021F42A60|nr:MULTISPECIES: LacI family DNA-binding transcriptional regulator [unclassified Oceanotoga]MDN5342766.1 LacI family transcriptional regulator [Oceanotoga sp.]UYO99199.1 LacI family transcriptional regulator [Oceanotoga sp. DSM 15011]